MTGRTRSLGSTLQWRQRTRRCGLALPLLAAFATTACGAVPISVSSYSNQPSAAFQVPSTTTYQVAIKGGCGGTLTGILVGPAGPLVLPHSGQTITLKSGRYTYNPDALGCSPVTVTLTPS